MKEENSINNIRKMGNLSFMSVDILEGEFPSKKTELQSFSYLLIYFYKLSLPCFWSKLKVFREELKK